MMKTAGRPKAKQESGFATFLRVKDYDLEATLTCGQAFRWRRTERGWESVVAGRWVSLRQTDQGIAAEVAEPVEDWEWLEVYLQSRVNLAEVVAAFPAADRHLQAAVRACWGLRLLRQEPWECLASFLISSNKQIGQIRQIIERLCLRYGRPVAAPAGQAAGRAFPEPEVLAGLSEAELRECGMGFRARAVAEAAQAVAGGRLDLARLGELEEGRAREVLMGLRGVGPKIADCVLLFAHGFAQAFPVDVWVRRALEHVYFRRRRPGEREMREFVRGHFGPQAGYAQQYLFHYWRTGAMKKTSPLQQGGFLLI